MNGFVNHVLFYEIKVMKRIFNHGLYAILLEDDDALHLATGMADSVQYFL